VSDCCEIVRQGYTHRSIDLDLDLTYNSFTALELAFTRDIRLVSGLCTRINLIIHKQLPDLDTPFPPFIAHAIAQCSAPPPLTILDCNTSPTLLGMAIWLYLDAEVLVLPPVFLPQDSVFVGRRLRRHPTLAALGLAET